MRHISLSYFIDEGTEVEEVDETSCITLHSNQQSRVRSRTHREAPEGPEQATSSQEPAATRPALPLGSRPRASAKASFWALLLGGASTWDKGRTVKPQARQLESGWSQCHSRTGVQTSPENRTPAAVPGHAGQGFFVRGGEPLPRLNLLLLIKDGD